MAQMNIVSADCLVMSRRMMFRVIISQVVASFLPLVFEMLLCFLVLQPIISHVDGLGSSLLEIAVDKVYRCCVVKRDLCGWLGVPHFCECDAKWDGFFAVNKRCSNFCVRC